MLNKQLLEGTVCVSAACAVTGSVGYGIWLTQQNTTQIQKLQEENKTLKANIELTSKYFSCAQRTISGDIPEGCPRVQFTIAK